LQGEFSDENPARLAAIETVRHVLDRPAKYIVKTLTGDVLSFLDVIGTSAS
jgi:hypothetical protein